MECCEAVEATKNQVKNIPPDTKRIVIPVGSGMSLSGLLHGLIENNLDIPVLGVRVGADPTDRLNKYAPKNWASMVSLVSSELDYHQHQHENNFFGLNKTLNKSTEKFKKIYPEIDKYVGRWQLDPFIQLMCYEPNTFYNHIHCENDGHPKVLNRVFAWMIFLNTIKKGGGTYFKYQNITAKPQAGDLYIWPAGWTHFHQGIKATQEKKYILTGWYNYI